MRHLRGISRSLRPSSPDRLLPPGRFVDSPSECRGRSAEISRPGVVRSGSRLARWPVTAVPAGILAVTARRRDSTSNSNMLTWISPKPVVISVRLDARRVIRYIETMMMQATSRWIDLAITADQASFKPSKPPRSDRPLLRERGTSPRVFIIGREISSGGSVRGGRCCSLVVAGVRCGSSRPDPVGYD